MGVSVEQLQGELRGVFAREAADSLRRVESLLEREQREPGDARLLEALFREFHTLKVGAAAAGHRHAARELHDAETLLDAARAGAAADGPRLASLRGVVARVRSEVCVGPAAAGGTVPSSLALRELWPLLIRATAEAAALARKFVVLDADGGEEPMPAALVDTLRGVLLHLVRNAVAHGIEPPAARAAAGKPRVGRVHVHSEARDGAWRVDIADDGAGLDFGAIAAAARRRGWLEPDAIPDRETLAALILRSGFSTVETATALAGRGVGMDAAAHAVAQLGGSITAESEDGVGCTVRIAIPSHGHELTIR